MKKSLLTSSILVGLSMTSACVFAEEYGDYAKETMYGLVENHAGRIAGTEKEVLAGEYMKERMTIAGSAFTPIKQDFSYTTRSGQNIQSSNFVVAQTGSKDTKKTLYVGAHYDSAPSSSSLDRSTLEGLDDNASGAGVLTELVYQLSKLNPEYNIKFIAFGAEEQGLRGSRAFVDNLSDEEKQNAIGMINLDSLLTGDFMYVNAGDKAYDTANQQVVAEYSKLREDALKIAKDLGLEVKINKGDKNTSYGNEPYKPYGVGCCSDHESFDEAGIPVAGFEATNWDLGPDFDGYTQTSNPNITDGMTWHEPAEDNREFLTKVLGEDRINQRMRDFSKLVTQLIMQQTNADLVLSAQNLSTSQNFISNYVLNSGQQKLDMGFERANYLASNPLQKTSHVWFDAYQKYKDENHGKGHESQLAIYGEHAFKPHWVMGAGVYGKLYSGENQATIKRDASYGGQIYSIVAHPQKSWWNTTLLDYAKHDLDINHHSQVNKTSLPLLNSQNIANLDAKILNASSEIGYNFVNKTPLKHGVYLGASYQKVEFDEYLSGTPNTRTAFKVHENSQDAWYGNVGYQLQYHFNLANKPTKINARLGYHHVISQDDNSFKATALADNQVREVKREQEKDHYGSFKLGLGSELTKGVWLYGNAETTFGKETDDDISVQFGVQSQF